jgi:mono/diheme cytochrome c family protein
MAETPTKPEGMHETDTPQRDNRFHYYSGGEVKESEGTRVGSWLWIFYAVVLVGAVIYFFVGGALGPDTGHGKGFQPVGGSAAYQAGISNDLMTQHGTASGITYTSVDLSQLPVPPGQTVAQAVASGSDVYQSYCIGCHGPNEDGNGVNAGALNPKPRNLHDAPFMQAMSYQRITTSLHKGVPGTAMPRWENLLTDKQIADVIAYVFSLTAPPPGSPSTPQAPAEAAGTVAGGSKTFVNGDQNSPKPITPPVNGNPAAETNTAPPSQSGAPPSRSGAATDQTGPAPGPTDMTPQGGMGTGTEASKPFPPSAPDAGGASVAPPFSPGMSTPHRHAVPMPGSPAVPRTPGPMPGTTPSAGGTGM